MYNTDLKFSRQRAWDGRVGGSFRIAVRRGSVDLCCTLAQTRQILAGMLGLINQMLVCLTC